MGWNHQLVARVFEVQGSSADSSVTPTERRGSLRNANSFLTPELPKKKSVSINLVPWMLWKRWVGWGAGWWFQTFFIFIPTWGRFPFLTNIFQMGWNHQLVGFGGDIYPTKRVPRTSHISHLNGVCSENLDLQKCRQKNGDMYVSFQEDHFSPSLGFIIQLLPNDLLIAQMEVT